MQNSNIPTNTELPSKGQLIKSTIIAIFLAAVILLTIVLPAEYGVDPTGIGSAIGLLKMGEIKVSLAEEAAADKAALKVDSPEAEKIEKPVEPEVTEEAQATRTDEMTITLAPNEGKEIKLTMAKGAKVDFVWFTNGGKANFDAHADSKPLKISYHSYEKGTMERQEGQIEAAFDGNHGWFWRNRTSEIMKVTLQVTGPYTAIKKVG